MTQTITQKNIEKIPIIKFKKKEKDLPENEKTFLEFLKKGENGMPYEKILLENHFNRIQSILAGENPPPYELEIQPSGICNANCKHCWAKNYQKLENKLTNKEIWDNILEQVLDFKKNQFKIDIVKFCGSTGDPLVNPLTQYAINKIAGKRYLRLFTNGISLGQHKQDNKYIETIAKTNRLNLSLDAATTPTLYKTKPGAKIRNIKNEDILKAAEKIKKLNKEINLEISYVITKDNYLEISEATKKARDIGADLIRFRIDMTDRTVSKKHGQCINESLDKAKLYEQDSFKVIPIHSKKEIKETNEKHFSTRESGFKCFTSKIWACIGANASLYPCGHISTGKVKNYGSLIKNGFSEIWNSDKKTQVIKELPFKKCSVCSPFSKRTNEFMTWFLTLPSQEQHRFYNKYLN
jgi:radical SAM protein with 4Fe4S-binding SPASM domain